jgi:hypothetical protein
VKDLLEERPYRKNVSLVLLELDDHKAFASGNLRLKNDLLRRFTYYPDFDGSEPIEDETLQDLLTSHKWGEIAPFIELLPPFEADVLELSVLLHKPQADIAEIFEITQPGVSWALNRTIERIQYWLRKPVIDPALLEETLKKYVSPKSAQKLTLLFVHNSQATVSKVLGLKGESTVVIKVLRQKYLKLRTVDDPIVKKFVEFMDWVIAESKWNMQNKTQVYKHKRTTLVP